MIDVIIIGSGCLARECHELWKDMLRAAPGLERIYRFRGFVRWQGEDVSPKEATPLLGEAGSFPIGERDMFVIGLAEPYMRKAAYESFKGRNASFLTLTHPWAAISPEAEIGEGNIFQRWSTVFCDSVVGNGNYFSSSINLAHDVTMGDFNMVGPSAFVLGQCRVGNVNTIGAQSVLLPKARIGNGNTITPGSIVYKGCGNGRVMVGNPALDTGSIITQPRIQEKRPGAV
ncbi:transferase [Desulfovibrio sp.]|uniref:transferase n=1 Tax=Desulfovibrio sp. TaxID=885 RepID=UPI0025B80F93|nr:transferase [Desulfovibrio sp.]MCI7569537.1 transferase [Desulfovibrio sp.]